MRTAISVFCLIFCIHLSAQSQTPSKQQLNYEKNLQQAVLADEPLRYVFWKIHDATTKSLIKQDSTFVKIEDNGHKVIFLNYSRQPGQVNYQPKARITTKYNNDSLLESEEVEIWNSGWKKATMEKHTYTPNGLQDTMKRFNHKDTAYVLASLSTWAYNNNGNLTLSKQFNDNNNTFGLSFRTHHYYNATGNKDSIVNYSIPSDSLRKLSKRTFGYDNQQLVKESFFIYDSSMAELDTAQLRKYSYNNNGYNDTLRIVNYETDYPSYTNDHDRIEVKEYHPDGDLLVNTIFQYDTLQNEFVKNRKDSLPKRNANGVKYAYTSYYVDSTNSFVYDRRGVSKVDEDGDLLHTGTDYYNRYGQKQWWKWTYIVLIYGEPTGIPKGPNLKANVYPVPASNEMRFELPEAAQQITLRVYDMSGKRISLIRGEGNAIIWHIPHRLEAGNYIYQIRTEEELFSGKVVVAGE